MQAFIQHYIHVLAIPLHVSGVWGPENANLKKWALWNANFINVNL